MRQHLNMLWLAAITATAVAQIPQHQVVPAAYTSTDAISYEWVAGASQPLRQQTLIGPSHLQNLLGSVITALELRRTATNQVYNGGAADLDVTMSTSPNAPLSCSNRWADNVGPDVTQVFSGTVAFPTSPPIPGGPMSPVAWTPSNVIRIEFQSPFLYQGGTLCVDVRGTPIAGQIVNWWMSDAMFEDIQGTKVQIGAGCGQHGGPSGEWAYTSTRTLLPGAYARFWARGFPNTFAIAAFGQASPMPIPLSAFGIPAPGCNCYLAPSGILASFVVPFVPEVHPLLPNQATAEFLLRIPADASVFGLQLTTQWFDLGQPAASNAITWSIANQMPTLDMALNEGHPTEQTGNVTVHLAQVMRFEYQ
jgi:hypothetical protein